ncbi:MAG TPA: FHA domain-containing protein [Gammaproteobacteria bacterium]|nr:FHA domain-containing protein [Gammaproteobacteria bacterium]
MTGQGKDKNNPNGSPGSKAQASAPPHPSLEQALAEETRTSASLRDSLEALRKKVEQMEASFEQRLGTATARHQLAESRLADQQSRLEALGQGREDTMRALADARRELALVKVERDQLRQQLARIDGMQTSTLALPEDEPEEAGIYAAPPSLDELMASLGSIEEAGASGRVEGHLHMRVETPGIDESQELIAPELVFAEELAESEPTSQAPAVPTSRVLVLLDGEHPIKFPLYKSVMTIGRAESADIQVRGDFVSRVHARLLSSAAGVVVEDVSSKNGIRVNAEHKTRATLKHGDILGLGRIRFTFIDANAADLD